MPTYAIHTLGCKVNQYESTLIGQSLEDAGILPAPPGEPADICIVNTCAVTAEAERKARQIIRHAVSENPGAYVIVTGCYAQLRPKELAALDGVAYICGNRSKLAAARAAVSFARTGRRQASDTVETLENAPFERSAIRKPVGGRVRAYVKIEDGCDSSCAYCAIRAARGPVRSKPLSDVVAEVSGLARSGYREVVLTGIEISAYGRDHGQGDLADLTAALSGIPGLERVRLGSLDPALLTPAFADRLAACPNLAHHFHLSLQSGCDRTLAAMRRKYNTAMVTRNIAHLREIFSDVCFTADTIVGFPGESDADFARTAGFIDGLDLLYNHIFPFSRRPDTEADRMPGQIPPPVKSARLHTLEGIREQSARRVCESRLGRELLILCEEYENGAVFGHSADFLPVAAPAAADLRGEFLTVRADRYEDGRIVGEIVGTG